MNEVDDLRDAAAQKDFFRALKTLSTEMRDAKIQEDAKTERRMGFIKVSDRSRSLRPRNMMYHISLGPRPFRVNHL